MIKNIIIVICTMMFALWVLNNNHITGWNFENCSEMQALNSLAHIAFGLGLGAFWTILFDNKRTLLLSFLCVMLWESYEFIFLGPHIYIVDTFLDIILGISFSWMYLKWTSKQKCETYNCR